MCWLPLPCCLQETHVLVMTPQLLLNMLEAGVAHMHQISLLVRAPGLPSSLPARLPARQPRSPPRLLSAAPALRRLKQYMMRA